MEIPSKKDAATTRGLHVLKSYLNTLSIPFQFHRNDELNLNIVTIETKNHQTVRVGIDIDQPLNPLFKDFILVSSKDLTSFELEKSLESLHKVTEAAGYGKPLPFDRGEKPGERINYNDNFEDVYLRHSLFRRVPDATAAQMEPYMSTLKHSARRALYKWQSSFKSMGFGEDDLVNIGRIYLMSFIHFYATSEDVNENQKLLVAFLKQRFGEAAKISFKKALNSTCLPQHVASDVTSSEDGEISFIETFAESADASPDEEYEEDSFVLTFPDNTEKTLRVANDGWLGLNFYLDGILLSKAATTTLTEDIRNERVKKRRIISEPVKEETEEELATRQKAAKEELYKKLSELEEEKRTILLGYAALSKDYSPDARRTARKLADELICPKCECKISSGNVCFTCKVEAIPLFGVDYIKFKEKLAREGHPMADAMNAPVPESEVRARAKRFSSSGTAFVDLVKQKNVQAKEVQLVMSKEDKVSLSRKLADELFKSLPPQRMCPKCKKTLPKEEFGIRVTHDKATGLPYRAAVQSYCKPCRRPK